MRRELDESKTPPAPESKLETAIGDSDIFLQEFGDLFLEIYHDYIGESQADSIELIEVMTDKKAVEFGQEIFNKHFSQLTESGHGIIEAEGYPAPQVESVLVFSLEQKRLVAYREYDYDKQEWIDYDLPVTVKDKLYLSFSQQQGLSIFIDHEDCLQPDPNFYQAIKEQELDPYRALRDILYKMSYTGPNRSELIQQHAATAAEVGIEIDPAKFENCQCGSSRMHCYLSGWKSKSYQPVLDKTIASLTHTSSETANNQEFFWNFIKGLDENSLMSLLRMDQTPFLRSADELVLEVSRVFIHRLLGIGLDFDFESDYDLRIQKLGQELPEFRSDIQVCFIYHALNSFVHSRGHRGANLSLIPSLELKNKHVFFGLISMAYQFKEDAALYQPLVELLSSRIGNQDQVEKIRHLLELHSRIRYLDLNVEVALTRNAREVTKLDLVNKALNSFVLRKVLFAGYRYRRSSFDLALDLGRSGPRFDLPISQTEVPSVPTTDLGLVESRRGYSERVRKYSDKSILSLLGIRDFVWIAESDSKVFRELLDYISHPWVRQQFNDDELQALEAWTRHVIEEIDQMTAGPEIYSTKQIQEFIYGAVNQDFLSLTSFTRLIERFIDSLYLAYSYDQMGRALERCYCSLSLAELTDSAQPLVKIGSEYYPFDLSLMHLKDLRDLEREISAFFGRDENEDRFRSQYTQIGMRLLGVLAGYDIVARDYYTGEDDETVWYDWELSAGSREIVDDFWSSYDKDQIDLEADDLVRDIDWCRKIGLAFTQSVRDRSRQLWSEYISLVDDAERIELVQEIRDYYFAIYELFHLESDKFRYRTNKGLFTAVSLYEKFDHLLELIEDPVQPISPLALDQDQPLVLLGANEAGKSSILRTLTYTDILARQQLPQPGEARVSADLNLDSVVGVERQLWTGSLFTQMIPSLNKLVKTETDDEGQPERLMWIMDELGRRTNRSYGLSIFMTAMILSKEQGNLFAGATHYHDLPFYRNFFEQLGIEPNFRAVKDYDHTPLSPDQELESHVVRTLAKVFPAEELSDWPDQSELEEATAVQNPEEIEPVDPNFHELVKTDIIGNKKSERISRFSRLFTVNGNVAESMDARLFDFERGRQKQALIEALLDHDEFDQLSQTMDQVIRTHYYFIKDRDKRRSSLERMFNRKQYFLRLFEIEEGEDDNDKLAAKQELQERFDHCVSVFGELMSNHCPGLLNTELIPDDFIATAHMHNSPLHELLLMGGVFSYANYVKEHGVTQVEFTDEPKIEIDQAVNPNLLGTAVPNDIKIDLSGERTGTVITGENGSGKSNFLITVPWMLILGLSTGYVPAESAKINPDVIPVSLVQPVADTLSKSSMRMEADQRIRRTIQGLKLAQDSNKYVLTLLDEPGAPTSQTDATKLIRWLMDRYAQVKNAHLMVTTHCDDLHTYLKDEADYLAFKLLSETPYTPQEGIGDSNALEVAKSVGLDELFYQVSVAVHDMIAEVEQLKSATEPDEDSKEVQQIFSQYAQRIRSILDQADQLVETDESD